MGITSTNGYFDATAGVTSAGVFVAVGITSTDGYFDATAGIRLRSEQ